MVKKVAKKKLPRKKVVKKKRASAGKCSLNLMEQAIASLEASEGPFYEGMETLKLARREAKNILDNANFYHHAARAIGILAKRKCQIGWVDKRPCFEQDEHKSKWCEPCWALHIINGGTP